MFKIKPNIIIIKCLLYLIKLPVMFLNDGFIFNPDFHPETLLLAELTQVTGGIRAGGVALTVLHLPGLNKAREDPALLSIGSQISPPIPLRVPGKVSEPGLSAGRTVRTGKTS